MPRGALFLEYGAQLLSLPTLLVELGLKLLELRQLCLRAAELDEEEGAAGGTTGWFACASAPPFPSSPGMLSSCPSAS